LVRPLVVVALEEGIEARLLLEEVRRGGFSRFLLQHQVHPLVAAVLLGVSGLDGFDLDAEAQPQRRPAC
jgi:hypothetical protein